MIVSSGTSVLVSANDPLVNTTSNLTQNSTAVNLTNTSIDLNNAILDIQALLSTLDQKLAVVGITVLVLMAIAVVHCAKKTNCWTFKERGGSPALYAPSSGSSIEGRKLNQI